ncbi:hypothetical protein SMACR_07199 [Sordaria macrospora]|uniref:WGS project CABT00000000 data, contig 2.40 n=2 Tax=Sordaria macrospora TaxID=5147 RepID=F7W7T2_SORMK|nr:uncharacterized protein SMAC_07199 [Sordaria macrospora k-hell]KAA8631687.1 hypothetical protein SMACR_07199 [Sordaria macrospora]KAH7626095.1 hypothetical protein B0T09DRAFT_272285 [Sordaria sp. MPI-SDFR-AT-0083]WPJ61271.1 hypothetical protein SMAC4_07199 [Sordaria macrospora]CCC13574.1 unnamed protein product [Sordaria macrospora k-hell]
MSSPLNKGGGFYYDIKGHIQPRRCFDHAGRLLPGNTKNTSYSSIQLPFRLKAWNPRAQRWASLGGNARHRRRRAARQQASRSSPLFTSSMKPEFLLAQYGRKEPSLRLKLLREKAKEAYVHLLILEWAWLAHQLDKMRRAGTAAEHSDPGSDSGSGSGSICRTTPAPGRDLTRNKRGDLETRRSDVMDRLDECDARPYNSEEQSEPPKDEDDRPAIPRRRGRETDKRGYGDHREQDNHHHQHQHQHQHEHYRVGSQSHALVSMLLTNLIINVIIIVIIIR